MLRRSISRRFYNGVDPIGKVHPDQLYGNTSINYQGPGWAAWWKSMPQEALMLHGGSTLGNAHDRAGWMVDPEDVRHPLLRIQMGERQGFDGAVQNAAFANFGPIPDGSRLLQVLYDNYLEPFSCHRLCGMLKFMEKTPNNHPTSMAATVDYMCDTGAMVGQVIIGVGVTVLNSVTMRGDTNAVYIAEGSQIMENVCIMSDAPSTLHHYQRGESFNPYQTFEAMDGVCKVGCNTIVEPNCYLDSCHLGPFNKIGHNTKIMKGVTSGILCHVKPGSVVIADTKMMDGELWGGAPAVKLGKISKFEWKKPYFSACHHRDMVTEQYTEFSRWGDQVVHHQNAMDDLTSLAIQFKSELPTAVKAQMDEFQYGREPFQHTVARMTQDWMPANRADDKCNDHLVPNVNFNNHREHNDDAGPADGYVGTIFNVKSFLAEKRW